MSATPSKADLLQRLAMLRRLPMRSSAVATLGFDPELRLLAVQFVGKPAVFGYPGLSDEEVRGLRNALLNQESLGHYVSTVIKPRHNAEHVRLDLQSSSDASSSGNSTLV